MAFKKLYLKGCRDISRYAIYRDMRYIAIFFIYRDVRYIAIFFWSYRDTNVRIHGDRRKNRRRKTEIYE